MEQVSEKHKQQYPHMEIQDTAKLLYQSEFGGGHIITDEEASLEYIEKEYKRCKEKGWMKEDRPIVVSIGNELCRMDLAVLEQGLCPQTLNHMFVKTANKINGSAERLEKRLRDQNLYENQWVVHWKEKGYPPLHHSEAFRQDYHPAYRVVWKKYADFLPAFLAIDRLRKNRTEESTPILVAIDGPCTAGKTTLGDLIKEIYDCNLFHMDDFFLRPEQKTEKRLDEVGGNIDYERFQTEILSQLRGKEPVEYQVYSCKEKRLMNPVRVPHKGLNIIEGSYSQHPYFGDCYNLRIFLDIDEETQVKRIFQRNGADMLKRFQEEWIPKENQYFLKFQIREKSLVISPVPSRET